MAHKAHAEPHSGLAFGACSPSALSPIRPVLIAGAPTGFRNPVGLARRSARDEARRTSSLTRAREASRAGWSREGPVRGEQEPRPGPGLIAARRGGPDLEARLGRGLTAET